MDSRRGLLFLSTEEEEPSPPPELQTTWYPEYVVKNEPDEPGERDYQPDIHKVWIRTSDSKN